jgi:trehalose 6-phosphate synthase complex regulatory subunit
MNSLKPHRVIIASLFLPNSVVLGDSLPPTPHDDPISIPAVTLRLTTTRISTPLKSIVEDLKDKVTNITKYYSIFS